MIFREVALICAFFLACGCAANLDGVQELHKVWEQLKELIDQRQEDNHIFEQVMKKSVDRTDEVSELRRSVIEMRNEIDSLKADPCHNCGNGNRAKNDHLTVQWLASSVTEIRSEIGELARSFNSTMELQQQRMVNTEISILKNDIVTLRHDVESLKGDLMQTVAKLATMSQDVDVSRQLSHKTAALTAELTTKLKTIIIEWGRTIRSLQNKKEKVYKRMVVTNEDPLEMKVETTHVGGSKAERIYKRHSKHMLKELKAIKEAMKIMQGSQKRIKSHLHHMETKLSTRTIDTCIAEFKQGIEPRLLKLETNQSKLEEIVVSIDKQLSGQEKLHTNMMELLESVESLETKVDTTTPDLRREIAKLEVSIAEVSSSAALLKEDQENEHISLKALGDNLSMVQEKIGHHQTEITTLHSKLTEVSAMQQKDLQQIKKNAEVKSTDSGKVAICADVESVYKELLKVKEKYDSIVASLPRDCSEVTGDTGVYVISPDGGIPITVSCEMVKEPKKVAYTVIQRRTNGVQDFNKNWEEYAHGFGNPAGEFWLGNEAIHRLTKHGLTKARVDLIDVSGVRWRAEYDDFGVDGRTNGFKLHVGGYTGNASDALEYQNGMQFSTVDSDRDVSNTNCAANYEGGWWFSHCQHTNLNGKYNLGLTWFDLSRNEWLAVVSSEIKLTKA